MKRLERDRVRETVVYKERERERCKTNVSAETKQKKLQTVVYRLRKSINNLLLYFFYLCVIKVDKFN